MYWEIEPYHTTQADSCIMPATTEKDHREALNYAKDRLEELWDSAEVGEERTLSLSLMEGDFDKLHLEESE